MKEKPNVGSPFFGAFPSDRIPKTTKDVIYIFYSDFRNFPLAAIPVVYTSKLREIFEATTCVDNMTGKNA